jgi:predicted MFS family arabinose efflux permease
VKIVVKSRKHLHPILSFSKQKTHFCGSKNCLPMLKKILTALPTSFSGIPRAVWLLSGVSLINRTGTMVVCFLTIYLTQELGFDLRSAGYVLVFYGIGTICGLYTGGWLTDKIGYRRVQFWSLILAGVAFICTMYVREFWEMCAMTFLFAFFGDAFRPANQVAIRMNSDDATRTRAFSLMRIAVNLAITVALVGGGLLVKLGWEWLFWVDGLTCFAAALMLHFFIKEKKGTPQYISDFGDQISENDTKNTKKSILSNEMSAYKDKDYLFFVFLTFVGATVFMQIIWTVPVFFKETYHWSEAQIGMASSFNALIVMTVEMPLIFRIENKRSAMWFVRLGIALYGLAYLAFFLPTHWAVLAVILYMIPVSFGEIFVMPFSTSWATKRAGTTRQGQFMGLYGMAYSISNVIAPLIGTQVIAAFGYSTLWLLMSVMSAFTFIGFWYLEQKNREKMA